MITFLNTQILQVKEWLAWKISTSSPPPANTSFAWTWKTIIHAIMLNMIISRWCNTFRTMQTGFLTPSPHPIHETWWLWWWPWWSCKQWWPWFFYRLGREMVTYLVHLGSTTGFPMELTHCRTIMGWSSVHGKRRENIKKASGVKGFLVWFFHRQSFCWKALADLPLVHSCIIFLCCLDGPSDNDKDHVVGLLTNLSLPPHPS